MIESKACLGCTCNLLKEVPVRRLVLCTIFFSLTGLVFTSLTGLSPDPAHSAAPDDDAKTIAKELRQLSNQWAKAFTNHDVAFGQRIFADDFTYIMPDGTERNKKAFLKLFRIETGGKTFTSVVITSFNVRVYGSNFAVVTGADQLKGTDKDGKPFSMKGRFTNVWVRKKGTWQVVAGHACLIE